MSAPIIKISDEAAEYLSKQFEAASEPYVGLLVNLAENKGCAGGEYKFSPLVKDDVQDDYEVIEDQGITLYVPRAQILFIFGAELVLHKDKFNTRLDFNNPNETARCGCGESIDITPMNPKP